MNKHYAKCEHLTYFICSEPSQLADIAEAVQVRLDAYKADKRDLGSVSFQGMSGGSLYPECW